MRIAMLSWETLHSIAAGGVATHVTELAAAMARAGHEVHIFTRIAEGQREYERILGVHYHRCPYPGHHDLIDDANNMCRAFVDRVFATEEIFGAFDVVHAHDWLAANAMIWIKQGRGHFTVFTVHSTEYARCGNSFPDGPPQRIRDQERAGCYWADQVIAVSQSTRQEAMWMYELPDWKSTVVFNGVAAQRFQIPVDQEPVRRRYAIGPLDPVVLFCGRLEWQKGPDLLIETLPAVLEQHPRTKYLFVGDGSLRPHVEQRAHEMGCGDAIRMAGKHKDEELVRLFRIADLVAVPSRNEPFGLVVLEAWSAGKPVVVTHCGGPGEYVWHEVNGLKVYANPNSIAWGIVTTFNDFGWARWMGERGREAVEAQFSWERVADETLAVYAAQRAEPPTDPLPEAEQAKAEQVGAESVGAELTDAEPAEAAEAPPREPAVPDGAALALQASAVEGHAAASDAADRPQPADEPAREVGDAESTAEPEPPPTVHATVRLNPLQAEGVPQRDLAACERTLDEAGCHPYRDGTGFAVHGEAKRILDAIAACHRLLGRRDTVELETRIWSHHDRAHAGADQSPACADAHADAAPRIAPGIAANPTLKPLAPADKLKRRPRKRPAATQRALGREPQPPADAPKRAPNAPPANDPEPVVDPDAADAALQPPTIPNRPTPTDTPKPEPQRP